LAIILIFVADNGGLITLCPVSSSDLASLSKLKRLKKLHLVHMSLVEDNYVTLASSIGEELEEFSCHSCDGEIMPAELLTSISRFV